MSESTGSPAPVLIVTPWYLPSVDGVAEVAERLHRGMLSHGVASHLLVCGEQRRITRDSMGERELWRYHVPGYVFNSLRPRAVAGSLWRVPGVLWQLYQFARQRRIRTVIILYQVDFIWPFVLLGRLLKVRLVLSLHGGDVRGYHRASELFRWLFRHVLRTADEVVVCSERLGRDVRAICPESVLPLHLIGNCVNVDHFAPPPPDHERRDPRPTAVHISNFATVKRTLDIVDAFASPEVPNGARLVMVGAGREYESAVARAHSLGIEDRVVFVGNQEDVRPFLWDADLFVVASEAEGAPLRRWRVVCRGYRPNGVL